MADTTLNVISLAKRDAQSHIILTANSASSMPSGDYISFKAVFQDENGNDIERTITDADGNAVQLTAIDQMVVLDYNFLTIKATYSGTMPSDLKVYMF